MSTHIAEFEERLGISFHDKSLLQRALTHRSFVNETESVGWEDNERLEFLGDAIIDAIVAEFLYHRFPEMREGTLTNVRSNLVRREALASFARQLDLGSYLFMGLGEAQSGGRAREATLCAAFEALVGAIYLDQGWDVAREFVLSFVREALPRALERALKKDAKTRLQEWSQAVLHETPTYVTVAEEGPDHAKAFTVEVRIGGITAGQGQGSTKQAAAQRAAARALEHAEDIERQLKGEAEVVTG